MDTDLTEKRRPWKTAGLVALAVAIVLALAGASAWAWRAQGRTSDDLSLARWQRSWSDGELAKSLMPMIDELEVVRGQVASLQPGTAEYDKYARKLMDLQNLIGEEMPVLVYTRDAEGNVTIVGAEMARAHLKAQIDLASRGRQ